MTPAALTGESFALLAALAYGLAGVAIAKGKARARSDNGLALSVVVTTALAAVLWSVFGHTPLAALARPDLRAALVIFATAGLCSTVLGRGLMYRATERVGPVLPSLLRRLTPVFALPLAALVLGQMPGPKALTGAALVLCAVVLYTGLPKAGARGHSTSAQPARLTSGLALGTGSAAAYALAYTLRGLGLLDLPDAALGGLIGGMAALVWLAGQSCWRAATIKAHTKAAGHRESKSYNHKRRNSGFVWPDAGPWHWAAAIALSTGQLCQLYALASASVVTVATLGTLEVFFTAVFAVLLIGAPGSDLKKLALPLCCAALGVALLIG